MALPLAILCSSLPLAALRGGPAHADAVYSGTTEAAALRLGVHDPEIVPLLSGGGTDLSSPLAQSAADSFGRARALASLAYAGDDIAGLSTFLGVVLPPSVPVRQLPPYPLTVVADQATPAPDSLTSPAYDLTAKVTKTGAASSATGGASDLLGVGGNAVSTGSVLTTQAGGLVATARTVVTGFRLAGLLSLGTVTTEAKATRTPSGKLERETSFDLTGASVAGLPLAVHDGHLVVPVLGDVLDVNQAIASLPALATLRQQGVSLSLHSATPTPSGVTATGLEITITRQLPAVPLPSVPLPALLPQQPQVGPLPPSTVTIVYTLGWATASATLNPLPSFDFPSSANGSLAAVTPPGTPQLTSTGATPQLTTEPAAPTAEAPLVVPPATSVTPELALAARAPIDLASAYLAVTLSAIAALVISQLIRHLGIRTGGPST